MNYPAASCEVSEDRNGMIMPPHPTLSRQGRGNSVTPQQAAGNHPDSKQLKKITVSLRARRVQQSHIIDRHVASFLAIATRFKHLIFEF
jgi:hypothetical protein